jgi:pyruvyl transferase EpsI
MSCRLERNKLKSEILHFAHRLDKSLATIDDTSSQYIKWSKTNLISRISEWDKLNFHPTEEIIWAKQILQEANNGISQAINKNSQVQANFDILNILKERRSIRTWTKEKVSSELIFQLIEAARWAPSSGNRQLVRIVIIDSEECKKLIVDMKENYLRNAPLLILVGVDISSYSGREKSNVSYLDAGAAIQNMILTAHSLGLGGVWCRFCEPDWINNVNKFYQLKKNLKLPGSFLPMSVVAIGWPNKIVRPPARHEHSEFVTYNSNGFEADDYPEWAPSEVGFNSIFKQKTKKIPMRLYRFIKSKFYFIIQKAKNFFKSISFCIEHKKLRSKRKILYVLLPPSSLPNIGDHAQVVAIREWFGKHYSDMPIIEFDKNDVHSLYWAIKFLSGPDDIFFIHSGGNLGDRGIWSESGRRRIISGFTKNQIVSLPQTIYFSNSVKGQAEKKISQQVYATHPNLTIMGRDYKSGKIAKELFPKAKTFSMPDFVLSLDGSDKYVPKPHGKEKTAKILLCLRKDNESKLSEEQFNAISKILPFACEYYDTTLDKPLDITNREAILLKTLEYFSSFDAVVTDRFHGLIFSVICRMPTVVLPTVDHKLTSVFDWFGTVKFVEYVNNIDMIPDAVTRVMTVKNTTVPDWNKEYFDKIPNMIGH